MSAIPHLQPILAPVVPFRTVTMRYMDLVAKRREQPLNEQETAELELLGEEIDKLSDKAWSGVPTPRLSEADLDRLNRQYYADHLHDQQTEARAYPQNVNRHDD